MDLGVARALSFSLHMSAICTHGAQNRMAMHSCTVEQPLPTSHGRPLPQPPFRRAATKYLILLDGGTLPPAPCISALSEGEYTMYERDMSSKEVRAGAWLVGGRAGWVHRCQATHSNLRRIPPSQTPVATTTHNLHISRACWSCCLQPWGRCST